MDWIVVDSDSQSVRQPARKPVKGIAPEHSIKISTERDAF